MGGLRALLAREDWIYLLGLLVPLAVYNIGLKAARVLGLPGPVGPVEFLDQVRSEVFFNLGYAALWIGLFALVRRGAGRWVLLVLFHLAAILVAAIATSAHFFYETTGSVLDYDLIVQSLHSWGDIQGVIANETTTLHWLLMSVVIFYAIAGPALLTGLFGSRLHVPVETPGRARFAPIAVSLLAISLGALSLLPGVTGSSKSFSRDPLANMVVTEFTEPDFEETSPEIETQLAAEDLPTDASLVQNAGTQKRNVVFIHLESTRAQATTPYNEEMETTPFMDKLADESLMAENAYTTVPHTSKAITAVNCGITPNLVRPITEAEPDGIPARCLPELLTDQGYDSVFFQSATEDFENRRQIAKNFGYEEFYPLEALPKEGFEQANYFGYEDDIMLPPSKQWLEEQKKTGRPFVAEYLTVTVHHDYKVPGRYGFKDFAEEEEYNRYLNTIYYQDRFLENLIDQYKEMGLYEDTIFVLYGDHGEGFGEHGRRQHDNTIYEEGIRIPLLIHDPQRFENGMRVIPPTNQLDVMPTVLDLLGYGVTGGTYPGSSLVRPLPMDRAVYASCFYDRTCMASIKNNEKYVYHFGNQEDEYFDLSEDPAEKQNVADDHAEEIDRRRESLLEWRSKVNTIYERHRDSLMGETTMMSE
ncbi:sulfatase-like hydrolase/transferase [Rubrobacter marinus]|uniref:Sulfatase-like hydrolase/transferase n=1 Tax=Rubrobacter marinus TaxID=2653852 RepID=A0A6G8Q3B9_9ACTN|nr:sulfatase-like hydrolase/transferase [Rubrobacter marinus]